MKWFKRLKLFKASNVTFNPKTMDAFSYGWWRFVAVVEGKLVFNNYGYSTSTRKHQAKLRRLLEELHIKVDLFLPLPDGIKSYNTLAEMIVIAEEYLCERELYGIYKRQNAYYRRKELKAAQLVPKIAV